MQNAQVEINLARFHSPANAPLTILLSILYGESNLVINGSNLSPISRCYFLACSPISEMLDGKNV